MYGLEEFKQVKLRWCLDVRMVNGKSSVATQLELIWIHTKFPHGQL